MLRRSLRAVAVAVAGVPAVLMIAVPAAPAHADTGWTRRLAADFRAAHQVTRGKGVTVAVLSSGVDGSTGSLRGVVAKGEDFVGTPRPKKIFGTLMASWIAGNGLTHDSPFGIRGLAPATRILSVRVFPDKEDPGSGKWQGGDNGEMVLAKGIRYAVDKGAQVIAIAPVYNGGGQLVDTGETALHDALARARARNVVVVAPAGAVRSQFSESTRYAFPAAAPGVIGVGALDTDGERYAKYSEKSTSVLVSAPGFKLPALGPGNSPWTYWGAAPAVTWVASTAALVRAEYPDLSPAQVAQAISTSARHPKGRGSYDTSIGFGVVNPDGALKEARRLADQGRPAITAKSGTTADKEHFGGETPDRIGAVRHPLAATAGFPGLMAAGLLALAGSFLLLRRRPAPVPATTGPAVPGAGDGEPTAPTGTDEQGALVAADAPSEVAVNSGEPAVASAGSDEQDGPVAADVPLDAVPNGGESVVVSAASGERDGRALPQAAPAAEADEGTGREPVAGEKAEPSKSGDAAGA